MNFYSHFHRVEIMCIHYFVLNLRCSAHFPVSFLKLFLMSEIFYCSYILIQLTAFSSVAQLCLTLWLHGLQHTRLPCPSLAPGACSNSCSSSRWCHPTISLFVIPFSSCLQSFPASESFPVSHFFASGGQSIGVSTSASVLQWIFRTDFL